MQLSGPFSPDGTLHVLKHAEVEMVFVPGFFATLQSNVFLVPWCYWSCPVHKMYTPIAACTCICSRGTITHVQHAFRTLLTSRSSAPVLVVIGEHSFLGQSYWALQRSNNYCGVLTRKLICCKTRDWLHLHDHIDRDGRASLSRSQVWWRQRPHKRVEQTPRSSCWQIFGALHYLHGAHMHAPAGTVRLACRTSLPIGLKAVMSGPQMARNTLTWPVVRLAWALCKCSAACSCRSCIQIYVLHRYWCSFNGSLSPQGREGYTGPSKRLHHCPAKRVHVFSCHGTSACLHASGNHVDSVCPCTHATAVRFTRSSKVTSMKWCNCFRWAC